MNNAITLVVSGREYGGWKKVSITAGIERVARDFSLSITRSWPNAPRIRRAVMPFDSCEVYIGSDLVLTGDIDSTPISYDAESVTVSVNGRSKTARLVDCSASNDPGQWSGSTVESIASALGAVYSVDVKSDVDTGGAVSDHQIQQGETAFESIDRLLQLRQLLATDTARGELLITQASEKHSGETLLLGEGGNILTGDAALDFKDVFSEYTCKGQRSSTETESDDDDNLPSLLSATSAASVDTKVPYSRPMIIKMSGQADAAACADRAEYERDYRRSKALATTYTVQGWRKKDGQLWVPNELVRVRDSIIGIDADWLIIEIEYSIDDGGTICRLTVAPRAGYVARKIAQKKKAKSGGGSGSDFSSVESADGDDDAA